MANIDKKFIVSLQGKEFVTYEGLLDVAHQLKLSSIETELIQIPSSENGNQCIVKAVVKTEDGKQFEGYGDASPNNVNRNIAPHLIRMAETRAKARALRDLTNIGMTALEELGDDETIEGNAKQSGGKQRDIGYVCSECGIGIKQGVAAYSKKYFGKQLCMECQKKYKKAN